MRPRGINHIVINLRDVEDAGIDPRRAAGKIPLWSGVMLMCLTQEQLAERMHTTQAVIARLESGRIKPSTRSLERLAAPTGMRLRISFEPAPAR